MFDPKGNANEDPDDARWRHWAEGKIASAVLHATQALQSDLDMVKRALFGNNPATGDDAGLVADVRRIKGWLIGDTTAEGEPKVGIVQKVAGLWALRTWLMGLLATIAAGVLGQLALSVLDRLTGSHH